MCKIRIESPQEAVLLIELITAGEERTNGYWDIGRPPIRLSDSLVSVAGHSWIRPGHDSTSWKSGGEAYVQQ
ncbi:hypothetical protein EVAR_13392_1 [Eumeta japonica]|uniref:Uncharacterized protein n=1 Tax=Eumeta variegata TaxID=151549 RepID=A0A4C1TS01_EUMVA|nr:hypothetical protein EVAR_13392_1 [Eumeta japonica]